MILRRFTAADADPLARLHGDPAVMRYVDPPESRAVVESSTLPATSTGLDPGDVELGYRLLPSYWGRGLATTGARLLVRRAFAELDVPKVVATTMAVNTDSRRVLEKAGLRHVHTFHADWPDPLPGAEHGDVVYALTRSEWLQAK
ncbi:GNAT family N-acetyltransferase [Actinophytocola sp. NPDC049390]|uniref:GNAT family N-acetyltransferase n=1 Tax=Actinophytocola sp. NPDC049390 TaxID=3363894 RepID=UPI00379B4ECE